MTGANGSISAWVSRRSIEALTVLIQHEQRQSLSQRIDPKIIHANRILQLSSLELIQSIEAELLDNPALEELDDVGCAGDCINPSLCPYCSQRPKNDDADDGDDHQPEIDTNELDPDYEPFFANLNASDEDFDVVGNLEAEMTLREHLTGLMRSALPAQDHRIGEYLINSLDERGWLDGTTETISMELCVAEEEVIRILKMIHTFDPPGIGARSLQECMLLQIRYLCEEETSPQLRRMIQIAEKLISEHFDAVSANRYPRIARLLGVTEDELKRVVDFIRTRLNPFPANQFRPPWEFRPASSRISVKPDVIIRRTEAGFEIEALGVEAFALSVSPVYRNMYNEIKTGQGKHDQDQRKHVMEHVERAELFLKNLQQRRQTLKQITRCIVEFQTGFLETGSRQFLRPLTRTKIARLLNIHESTVSRATANKFIQLPNQEVVSFNLFFNSSLSIKDTIETLIHEENPKHPLSDQQIVALLQERGFSVARRTIVKYRESQKILSSTHRRR